MGAAGFPVSPTRFRPKDELPQGRCRVLVLLGIFVSYIRPRKRVKTLVEISSHSRFHPGHAAGPEVPRITLRCALPRTQLRTTFWHLGPCESHADGTTADNHNPADAMPSRTNPRPCRREPSKTSDQRGFAKALSGPLRCRRLILTACDWDKLSSGPGSSQGRLSTIVRDPKGFFPLHIEPGEQSLLCDPAV